MYILQYSDDDCSVSTELFNTFEEANNALKRLALSNDTEADDPKIVEATVGGSLTFHVVNY